MPFRISFRTLLNIHFLTYSFKKTACNNYFMALDSFLPPNQNLEKKQNYLEGSRDFYIYKLGRSLYLLFYQQLQPNYN